MKITKLKLKQIIKEEIEDVLQEGMFDWMGKKKKAEEPAEPQKAEPDPEKAAAKVEKLMQQYLQLKTKAAETERGPELVALNKQIRNVSSALGQSYSWEDKGLDKFSPLMKKLDKIRREEEEGAKPGQLPGFDPKKAAEKKKTKFDAEQQAKAKEKAAEKKLDPGRVYKRRLM